MELTITLALVNSFIYFLVFNKWFKAFGSKMCSFCILWWMCLGNSILLDISDISIATIRTAMAMTCISVTAYFYLKNNQ